MLKIFIGKIEQLHQQFHLEGSGEESFQSDIANRSYYSENERITNIAGVMLIRKMLREMNISAEKLHPLKYGEFGKPYFYGYEMDFNISHSGEYIVGAITESGKIGIDIEKVNLVPIQEYRDCFSDAEWNAIQISNDPTRHFYSAWTKKESLLKAYGFGLQLPLQNVSITDTCGVIHHNHKMFNGHFYALEVKGYCCHLCTTELFADVDQTIKMI
jgi:4'-phosphopantetheinyl transferase